MPIVSYDRVGSTCHVCVSIGVQPAVTAEHSTAQHCLNRAVLPPSRLIRLQPHMSVHLTVPHSGVQTDQQTCRMTAVFAVYVHDKLQVCVMYGVGCG